MITRRDEDLLLTLTSKGRMITPAQAARGWWPDQLHSVDNALRRLRKLARSNWLAEFSLLSRPLLPLREPLGRWTPGGPRPRFAGLAWKALNRWQEPASLVSVFVAHTRAQHHFGRPVRHLIKSHAQVTHDLHVTQVFLVYQQRWPDLAASWIGEDAISTEAHRRVIPDALLVNAKGRPFRAVEFGGRYRADRLEKFHADCAAHNLPYEVW